MPTALYQLRVDLADAKPPIWRRLVVPGDFKLGDLHEVLQIAFEWTDSHLHAFRLHDASLKQSREAVAELARQDRLEEIFSATRGIRVYGPTTDPFGGELDMADKDENEVTLAEVLTSSKAKLVYEYDFGDGWEHTIKLENIYEPSEGEPYPRCLTGRRAAPLEDCGGIPGYEMMLAALEEPGHEMHKQALEWLGQDFDPAAFNLEEVNTGLRSWQEEAKQR